MERSEIRGSPVRFAIPGLRSAPSGLRPSLSFRDAPLGAGPESITTNVEVVRSWGRCDHTLRRHRRRKRATQYSAASVIEPQGRGVLDPPLSRRMTGRGVAARRANQLKAVQPR